jgi:Secretion system C-terminal sorting domain
MKKIYVNLCMLFACVSLSAGTPVIDGVFDGTGVWGAAKAVSDLTVGWGGANAKKLYITSDATYIYFGAEIAAETWQKVGFVINTKSGGGATVLPNDPWKHGINYTYANQPDYVIKIDLGSSYGELRSSNGTDFSTSTTISSDVKADATQFVEVRVLKTDLGSPSSLQAQLYISGNTDCEHGVFDAVPDETNQNNWNGGLGCLSITPANPGTPNMTLANYTSLVVLPIELTTFTAKPNNSTVNLAWQTASEKGNSHFDIERSANGKDWSKIGMVKGSGTSQQKLDYRFTDEGPLSILNYYRLKQVDLDGQFNYSPVVTAVVGKGKLKGIFPNPTTDKVTLVGNDLTNDDVVTIFDLNGRNIKTQKVSGSQIDVSDLAKGFYILSISDINGQSVDRVRFVKQ